MRAKKRGITSSRTDFDAPLLISSPLGNSEDAYGRTLAYVYLDTDGVGSYEHLLSDGLLEPGIARTTDFSHAYRRQFERVREVAEERGAGLWSACPDMEHRRQAVS